MFVHCQYYFPLPPITHDTCLFIINITFLSYLFLSTLSPSNPKRYIFHQLFKCLWKFEPDQWGQVKALSPVIASQPLKLLRSYILLTLTLCQKKKYESLIRIIVNTFVNQLVFYLITTGLILAGWLPITFARILALQCGGGRKQRRIHAKTTLFEIACDQEFIATNLWSAQFIIVTKGLLRFMLKFSINLSVKSCWLAGWLVVWFEWLLGCNNGKQWFYFNHKLNRNFEILPQFSCLGEKLSGSFY